MIFCLGVKPWIGTTKASAVDLSRLNTLRGIKAAFKPLKV